MNKILILCQREYGTYAFDSTRYLKMKDDINYVKKILNQQIYKNIEYMTRGLNHKDDKMTYNMDFNSDTIEFTDFLKKNRNSYDIIIIAFCPHPIFTPSFFKTTSQLLVKNGILIYAPYYIDLQIRHNKNPIKQIDDHSSINFYKCSNAIWKKKEKEDWKQRWQTCLDIFNLKFIKKENSLYKYVKFLYDSPMTIEEIKKADKEKLKQDITFKLYPNLKSDAKPVIHKQKLNPKVDSMSWGT